MLFDETTGQVIPAEETPQDYEAIAKQEIDKARNIVSKAQSPAPTALDLLGRPKPISRLSQIQQFSNQAGRSWDQNQIGQEEYYSGPLTKGGNRKSSVIDPTGEKGEMYTAGGYQLPQEDDWEFARTTDAGDLNRLGYNPFRS
jgi:hypothetical protein